MSLPADSLPADSHPDVASRIDNRLLLLHPADNVLVARTAIAAGTALGLESGPVTVNLDLGLGHKLARRPIAAGEPVMKYGMPIGSATAAIPAGGHVHVHNVKSDYTPTHHLYDARARHGEPS